MAADERGDVSDERCEDESYDAAQEVHMPETCDFEVDDDYDYLREGGVHSSIYRCVRSFVHIPMSAVLRLTFGLEVKGERDPLYSGGGAVVICNHVNIVDCILIDSLFPYRRMYYTTLESNFKIPVARHLIRFFGGIPIPKSVHKLPRFFKMTNQALENGSYVCFYPEGVLLPYYNGLRKFHEGAFRAAVETGSPIIPVVITYRRPDGLFALYKKKPCATVTVLPHITPEEVPDKRRETERLMNECREKMKDAAKNA